MIRGYSDIKSILTSALRATVELMAPTTFTNIYKLPTTFKTL